jgi:hypothetical protein
LTKRTEDLELEIQVINLIFFAFLDWVSFWHLMDAFEVKPHESNITLFPLHLQFGRPAIQQLTILQPFIKFKPFSVPSSTNLSIKRGCLLIILSLSLSL